MQHCNICVSFYVQNSTLEQILVGQVLPEVVLTVGSSSLVVVEDPLLADQVLQEVELTMGSFSFVAVEDPLLLDQVLQEVELTVGSSSLGAVENPVLAVSAWDLAEIASPLGLFSCLQMLQPSLQFCKSNQWIHPDHGWLINIFGYSPHPLPGAA